MSDTPKQPNQPKQFFQQPVFWILIVIVFVLGGVLIYQTVSGTNTNNKQAESSSVSSSSSSKKKISTSTVSENTPKDKYSKEEGYLPVHALSVKDYQSIQISDAVVSNGDKKGEKYTDLVKRFGLPAYKSEKASADYPAGSVTVSWPVVFARKDSELRDAFISVDIYDGRVDGKRLALLGDRSTLTAAEKPKLEVGKTKLDDVLKTYGVPSSMYDMYREMEKNDTTYITYHNDQEDTGMFHLEFVDGVLSKVS